MQRLDQINLAAEAGKGLRQLAADRPSADDGDAAGQFGQSKDGLVCMVAGFRQAGNGQFRRPGACGDNGAIKLEAFAIDFDRGGTYETSVTDVNVDAELAEALCGVMAADPGAQPSLRSIAAEKAMWGSHAS